MKTIVRITSIMIIALIATTATAADLPFPVIAAGKLYLPFGQQFYETNQKEKITDYKEPRCFPKVCHWIIDRPEGTVEFNQEYNNDYLTAFGLMYILRNDAAAPYVEKLRELKAKLKQESEESGDWMVIAPQDPLAVDLNFKAESQDIRFTAKYRSGEHSTTIVIDIQAK